MLPLIKALNPLKTTGQLLPRLPLLPRLHAAVSVPTPRLVTTSSLLLARLPPSVPPVAAPDTLPSFDDLSALFGRDSNSTSGAAGQDLLKPHDLFFDSAPLHDDAGQEAVSAKTLDSEYTRHVYFSRREKPLSNANALAGSADLSHLFEESSLFEDSAETVPYISRREDPVLLANTIQFEGLGDEANPPEIHAGTFQPSICCQTCFI
jgi:hypothetical protein